MREPEEAGNQNWRQHKPLQIAAPPSCVYAKSTGQRRRNSNRLCTSKSSQSLTLREHTPIIAANNV